MSTITWQPQTQDDLVVGNVIDQIMRTNASFQIMMAYQLNSTNNAYEPKSVNQFYSHVISLYTISKPLLNFKDASFYIKYRNTFFSSLPRVKTIKNAILFYEDLLMKLQYSRIWGITKFAKVSDKERGKKAVLGN